MIASLRRIWRQSGLTPRQAAQIVALLLLLGGLAALLGLSDFDAPIERQVHDMVVGR
jgi:hypothetical protein